MIDNGAEEGGFIGGSVGDVDDPIKKFRSGGGGVEGDTSFHGGCEGDD